MNLIDLIRDLEDSCDYTSYKESEKHLVNALIKLGHVNQDTCHIQNGCKYWALGSTLIRRMH